MEYTIDIETREAVRDLKKLTDQLKKTEQQTKDNDSAFLRVADSLTGFKLALAGIAGAAGLGALVSKSLDAADAIGKTASAANISTTRLQELQYAFGFAGIEADALGNSFTAFNKRLGRFVAEGGGAAKNALEALGLASEITSGQLKGTEAVIDEAIERLALVEDEAARAGLAAGIFGDTMGPKLAAALSNGTEGIAELAMEAHELNQVIGEEGIRAAESFNDQISKVGSAISGSFTKAIVEAAPEMDALAKMITDNQDVMTGLVDITFKLAEALVIAGGAAVEFAQDLGLIETSTQQQIEKVEAALKGGFTDRLKFFGPEGLVEYYDEEELNQILRDLKGKLKNEQAEASETEARLKALREAKANSDITQKRRDSIQYTPEAKAEEEERKRREKELAATLKEQERAAEKAARIAERSAKERADAEKRVNMELQNTLELYSPIATKAQDLLEAERQLSILRSRSGVNQKQLLEAEKNIALARKDMQQEQLDASRKWEDGWQRAFDEYVDGATNAAMQAEEVFRTTTESISDYFFDMARGVDTSLKGVAQNIVDTLLRQQTDILAGNVTGAIGGLLSGKGFAGFFASGGNIPAGQFGVVGEKGPEIVNGPATVTPMRPGGGGTQNVTYNINAVDASSFKQLVARDPAFLFAVTEEGRRGLPSF
jgi:lambda family phage tail tape measure protein